MPVVKGVSDRFISNRQRIKSLISKGYSGKKILEILREDNKGYRSSTFYADMRISKKANENWEKIDHISDVKPIPLRYYQETNRPMRENFSVVVEFERLDVFGHKIDKDYITVFSNQNLTKEDWFSYAHPLAEYSGGAEVGKMRIVEAYKDI